MTASAVRRNLILLAGALALAPLARAELSVADLRCDSSVNPLGIDEARPKLSWQLTGTARGERQIAWQVLVATSPTLLAQDRGDLWDSGRVASDATTDIRYAGTPLATSQQVFWKARSWDQDGQPSAWSAPASWTMGYLSVRDWKGCWITSSGASETLLLRHDFMVKPGLRRALVEVCGLGQYELTLNGAKAGDALLSPGWTEYNKTTLYNTLDVTSLLHAGDNAVGLFLGNGMYNVVKRDKARFTKFTGSFGPLRAILNLRLEYADGHVETVATDTAWKTHPGPVTFCSIYGGEDEDARLIQAGWDKPGFDDSSWEAAVCQSLPGKTLRGHSVSDQPVRAIEVRKPIAVKVFPDGTAVYDLGQNASYMPRIRVSGPAGSSVRLIPAEVTNPDGTINRSTMGGISRGSAWWQYTKATDGEETWMPRFFYSGARYLEAIFIPAKPGGALPKLDSLDGVIVHSSAAPVGTFAASNPLLGRILTLVRWAQSSNMMSILTDCPHRERLGWLEQDHLNGPSLRYDFNMDRIFGKVMNDMADSQTPDGLIPTTAPEYAHFKGTFRAAAEWGSTFIIVPWQQYAFTGDDSLIRDYYPQMARYFAYLESRAKNDILSEGLGDWYDLGPRKPGFAQLTPPAVTSTAYFYHDACLMEAAARLLGREADVRLYAAKAEQIRAAFNKAYYHADTGSYATNSQASNAMALVFGLPSKADRPRVLAALVNDLMSRGCTLTAGDIGYRYLLLALAEGGRSDLIYRMIDQDRTPGYAYILKKGDTSMTESWNANLSSSHDHFMLGQIVEWFYGWLVGIRPTDSAPGFKRILVDPQPVGDLTWAEAKYNSIRGPIHVRWDHRDRQFRLRVDIPADTTAEVWLPSRDTASDLESGRPAAKSDGVTFLRREGDRDLYSIESGHYDFTSSW
ncbi:bacterial alpha-L-rhamnosidase [mine drainage metagenome]|uniref:alpha-L-rhamnosidase n=1 Tax=mine drainage metagenome TaxID=410659 RepID=A0A1J5SGL1_9ZZZZ